MFNLIFKHAIKLIKISLIPAEITQSITLVGQERAQREVASILSMHECS